MKVDEILAKEKLDKLLHYLRSLGSVAVAFSGGVDSTFLLRAAVEACGTKAVAVTAQSAVVPARELAEAQKLCKKLGIKQLVYEMDVFTVPGFAENPPDRCYYCKKALFTKLQELAAEQGARLVEGSNMDDLGDYRPGLRALAELEVLSPLQQAELTKAEIRYLSELWQLPTWSKPSFACLASRFAYGERITGEGLAQVEGAEQELLELGFRQFRVRVHGRELARIEVPADDIPRLVAVRETVNAKLKALGFKYVAVDLAGYRAGSMNEVLK